VQASISRHEAIPEDTMSYPHRALIIKTEFTIRSSGIYRSVKVHHTPTSSKGTHGVVTEHKSCAKRNSSSLSSYPVFRDRAKSGRVSVRGAIIIGILIKQPGVFICR
jgi:hypothetical protein